MSFRRVKYAAGGAVLMVFALTMQVSGSTGVAPPVLRPLSDVGNVCPSIQAALAAGHDGAAVVKTAIELGYPSCAVIKCAIEEGVELQDVIFAATDAGTSTDVVSRCCIDAGGSPAEVSSILARPGIGVDLCYFQADEPEFLRLPVGVEPVTAPEPFPPSDQQSSIISPFTF